MIKVYIGLDVHKAKTVIAVAFCDNGEVVIYGKCSSDINRLLTALRRLLKKYGLSKEEVRICYEAGPCGFALARHLLRIGFAVEVVAPSLTPSKSGDRVKTDPRDAKKLARLFRAGELTPIHIPDEADEVIRDLCRARTDAVSDQTRSRHRLGSFLLRNGHHYTGRSNWTEKHLRYLRELVLNDPVQKIILEEYLQAIDLAVHRVENLEEHMRVRLEAWVRRPFVKALQGFRGFQMIASMVTASELGDLRRFKHPCQLMSYLGLVPSEYSSGNSRHQGSITKCGNSHVRWMLVEIAGCYRYMPKISKELSVRQLGLSRSVKALSWKTQQRLHKRYIKLKMRRLHENKIKVAIARELASFIWELAQIMDNPASQKQSAA
ncbi:IS110 family transposase [Verrucomicrobiota bacterium]